MTKYVTLFLTMTNFVLERRTRKDLITDKLEEEDEEEFIEFKEMETKAEFKYKLWKYLFAN